MYGFLDILPIRSSSRSTPTKLNVTPTSAMSAITGYPVMADRTIQEKDYYWIWQGRTGLSIYHPASEQISFASDFSEETGKYNIIKCIEKMSYSTRNLGCIR